MARVPTRNIQEHKISCFRVEQYLQLEEIAIHYFPQKCCFSGIPPRISDITDTYPDAKKWICHCPWNIRRLACDIVAKLLYLVDQTQHCRFAWSHKRGVHRRTLIGKAVSICKGHVVIFNQISYPVWPTRCCPTWVCRISQWVWRGRLCGSNVKARLRVRIATLIRNRSQ